MRSFPALRSRMALAMLAAAVVAGPGGKVRQAQTQEVRDVPGGGALRTAVRLSVDTVRVGEPFTVGVVATASDSVRFPPLLETGETWEQLAVARVESGESGEVRAYYRLVAWEAGRLELPAVEVTTGGREGRGFRLDLPAPWVRSVLPAAAEDVQLRGPRPPLGDRFPWLWWIALATVLASAWWWWRRRRRASIDAVAAVPLEVSDARERALAALAALREEASDGALPAAAFYDRLEVILRAYLAEAREWPPTRPVRASTWLSRDELRELHRHAVISRFAGVEAGGSRRLADVDMSIDWLSKDAA